MEVNLWNPGNSAQHHVLDAGLHSGGHGNRLAVATETGGDPENINLLNAALSAVINHGFFHANAPIGMVELQTHFAAGIMRLPGL